MKIVIKFNMFGYKQKIFIVNESGKVESTIYSSSDFDEVSDKIIETSRMFEIKDVDISGPRPYLERLAEKCYQKEIAKYNHNQIMINFI